MTISFASRVDLLDLHGRAAAASLAQLDPRLPLPPHGTTVRDLTNEHWGTLEIWAWLLEDPDRLWSEHQTAAPPLGQSAVAEAIEPQLRRLRRSLLSLGPDAALDYFGRPGTTAEVAKLLAHGAVTTAYAACRAAGRPALSLSPDAASDGIDQALGHWAVPDAEVQWQPRPVAFRATDTADAWHLALSEPEDGQGVDFWLVPPAEPVAVVEASAGTLLWWVHGYAVDDGSVTITADASTIKAIRSALLHPEPVEPKPRRKFWLFG